MEFEKKLDNAEYRERFRPTFEIGEYEDVESSIVFSAISKCLDNNWGNEKDEESAEEVRNQNIQDGNLRDLYQKIRELVDENDEILRWLAFVAAKDDKTQSFVLQQMIKYKGISEEEAKKLLLEFDEFYQQAKQNIDITRLKKFVSADINKRREKFPELKKQNC